MPNFNGKGPRNAGPMSGKGKGYCIKNITDVKERNGLFQGTGCGNGNGGGRRKQDKNSGQNRNK